MAEPMTEALSRLSTGLLEAANTRQAVLVRRAMIAGTAKAPELIRNEALSTLPKGGGLNEWVAAAVTRVTAAGGSRSAVVQVRTRRSGHDLQSVDRGEVRHPVFGAWRAGVSTEAVTPGFFSRPMTRVVAPAVTAGVVGAMHATVDDLGGA